MSEKIGAMGGNLGGAFVDDVIQVNYQGGYGGNLWDHGVFTGIRKVYVTCPGDLCLYPGISHIMVDYDKAGKVERRENGNINFIGQSLNSHEFVLDYPNEYITSVEGTCDLVPGLHNRVRSLRFKTSKERTSPTYGKVGQKTFVLESKSRALVGFHGRAGWTIDAIGAYFGPPPMEKLPGIGGDRGDSWDDGGFDGVRKIYVGLGENCVATVKFVYDKNNQVVLGEDHGKKTMLGYKKFELEYPNEYITAVEGCYDKIFGSESTVITMLQFKTNVRTSPPFGFVSTSSFVLKKEGHKIVGFHGKSSHELHQFGVNVACILDFNKLGGDNMIYSHLHDLELIIIRNFATVPKLKGVFSEMRDRALLEKVQMSLLAGSKVLADAIQKAHYDKKVRRWCTEFIDASFQADNILKDMSVADQNRQQQNSQSSRPNVSLMSKSNWNRQDLHPLQTKLEGVVARLEDLMVQIKVLELRDWWGVRMVEAPWKPKSHTSPVFHDKFSEPSLSKSKELHGENKVLYRPEPESSSQNYEDIALASKQFQKDLSYNLTTLSSDAGSSSGKMMPQEDQDDTEFESFKVTNVLELKKLSASLERLHIEGCPELEFLPESLLRDCSNLQELLLVDCHSLEAFPGGYPSTTLITLYIRDCMKLEFISSYQTMLVFPQLEDLFIGSSCSTLCSFPLALFPNLESLSLRHCEQFSSFTVTVACGDVPLALEALEITDCPKLEFFPEGGLQTLKLTSILISSCRNLKRLPAKLSTLTSLRSIHINECPELELNPILICFPDSLQTLCISRCQKLRLTARWGLSKLGNLRDLEIEGGNDDTESFPDKNLLPRSLYSLRISEFKNLRTLNHEGLEGLPALGILEISGCDKLASLADEGLPSSLSLLRINGCPILKEKIYKKDMEWFKIKSIELVEIDGKELLRGRKKKNCIFSEN